MPITTNTYPLFEHQEEGSSKLDDDSTLYQNSCPLKKVESKSTHTNVLSSKKQKRWFLFKKISYIVVMNAIIPIALYYILKSHLPAVWALVLSTTPTIISVIIQAIFLKRIDSIGVAVIFGFILSVSLAILNGDPKLLLMRESFITAGIGIVCSITLIPIRIKTFVLKPILYYFAKDLISYEPVVYLDTDIEQDRMEFYWQNSAYCRYHYRLLTVINVFILELEFGLKLFYVFKFDIDTVVILSNSTLSVIGIIVTIFTIVYIIRIKNQLKKEEPDMLMNSNAVIKAA